MKKILFGRSPADVVASCDRNLAVILAKPGEEKENKSRAKLEKNLTELHGMLYRITTKDQKADTAKNLQIINALRSTATLEKLLQNVKSLGLEPQKMLSGIISFWLRDKDLNQAAVTYFEQRPDLIKIVMLEYVGNEDHFLVWGVTIREALVYPPLLKICLDLKENLLLRVVDCLACKQAGYLEEPLQTLETVMMGAVNVKSKNRSVLSDDMRRSHRKLIEKWLASNYEEFFGKLNARIEPADAKSRQASGSASPGTNFVVVPRVLNLLHEMFMNKTNHKVTLKYIDDRNNLIRVMRHLRAGQNKDIQVRAFNVFKIFVANPDKSKEITDLLSRNRTKILQILQLVAQDDDIKEKFAEDIKLLSERLPPPPPSPSQQRPAQQSTAPAPGGAEGGAAATATTAADPPPPVQASAGGADSSADASTSN